MNLIEAIKHRHSIRKFVQKKPSIDVIHEIIHYANLAPSAGNLQARDFIIVENKEIQDKLSRAALHQTFISEAPFAIVVCANLNRISPYGSRGKELYCIQDASAAVDHILLLAGEYNLGACWVGAFDEHKVSTILTLPPYIRPVAIIPIGYPHGEIDFSSRLDTQSLIHYNQW